MSFLDLPVELQLLVIGSLNHLDILNCSLVCKHLHDLILSTAELQYRIELAYDGLIDGLTCDLPIAMRLQRLLDRRNAWRTLSAHSHSTVSVPGECRAYELVGGVFAKVLETNGFNAAWLPSTGAHEFVPLHITLLDIPVKDFALDPTQDLIMLLEQTPVEGAAQEVRVHVRRLSTGASTVHSDAKEGVLHACTTHLRGCTIQVVEDVVGLYNWSPTHGAVVWNWKTGETLMMFDEATSPRHIWDFAFLSSRSYAVTIIHNGRVDPRRFGGSIEIYTFGSTPGPVHVATLQFPDITPWCHVAELNAMSGPFTARVSPGKPFGTAPTTRVHTFTVRYALPSFGEEAAVCYAVHNRTLIGYGRAHDGGGPRVIAWEEWGVQGSRAFRLAVAVRWHRYVYGEHFAYPLGEPTDEQNVPKYHLVDFNIHPKREPDQDGLVAGPSTVDPDKFFCEPIVTELPYHSIVIPDHDKPYLGFMVDDERLLGLSGGPFFDDLGLIDVFTF
ncbi:hypothetical protein FA95DRAFT_247444 [Auriscalpium vulgare]|uniref:Uncharacterized protein n=1 Tax=Auriscalpium vulgare TaxID=40419 RepID=A0ACB8RM44_9AGAM|nr:hypothetical protein FA95DRAFT_247444 [Auriscalpium vulgare]